MRVVSRRNGESGMALITVFLVLMVASALMVGFFATIVADQRNNGIDRDQTQAYAAAHAGLEKLTASLATLFVTDYSPSKLQIDAIIAKPPVIKGFTYTAPGGVVGSGYAVTYKSDTTPGPNFGNPVPDTATGTAITAGPYAGFKGIITKYPITVTARSTGGAEVRLRRELQTVAVPVFQFGVFSETDLTFYAGDDFNFGGRVQTNGSLYLSEVAGRTLTLSDRVTAFKEVVRNNLSNGLAVSSVSFTGTVNVLSTPAGAVRALGINEGSVTGMPGPGQTLLTKPPAANSWTDISTGNTFYKSLLRNGLTGAKYLSLPLVSQGALPIDLIRRPKPPVAPVTAKEDATNPLVYSQRYYSMASLRILLSDTPGEITNLPGVTATAPVSLNWSTDGIPAGYAIDSSHPPMPTSPGVHTLPANQITTASLSNTNTIYINAASMGSYFRLPTIYVGAAAKPANCTGRTSTTFTGCVSTAGAATINSPANVTTAGGPGLGVPNGAGFQHESTVTTANWTPTTAAAGNTITVSNVAPNTGTSQFAPSVFWLHAGTGAAPATTNGEQFTCSGYDLTAGIFPLGPRLTGCTGLTTAPGTGATISTGSMEPAGATLNRGYIKIEVQDASTPPVWTDVTTEFLNLGISGPANVPPAAQAPPNPLCDPTPNAVIRLQHLRDNAGSICVTSGNSSTNSNDYWPNVLYDTREGTYRDDPPAPTDHLLTLGGMVSYVALDVANLKKWLAGTVAPFNAVGMHGTTANNQSGAGFIVYFSDRRNNKCNPAVPAQLPSCPLATVPVETGEYGFEDFVNPASGTGLPVNNVLDVGEDVNAIIPVAPAIYAPVQDIYGEFPPTMPVVVPPVPAVTVLGSSPAGIMDTAARPWTTTSQQWVGMINRPVLFRRALKLVNGGNIAGASSLPSPGLTVASENPVYVQGNYNASVGTTAGVTPTETHMAASILADAITLLSNTWNDTLSFQWPNDAPSRPASTTAYRFAAVSGKSLSFPWPSAGTPQFLFGTDGGVGNFLHLLEDWRAPAADVRYRGSIVSLFISRQALGTFKYSTRVYDYADRQFNFDDDFLLPAKLPPGTPMFRDVNTLTFRQLLRPNQ